LSAVTVANRALLVNFKISDCGSQSEFASIYNLAWVASLNGVGSQSIIDKSAAMYAVAMRNGDVGAVVGEPGSMALVVLALTAGPVARRKPLDKGR